MEIHGMCQKKVQTTILRMFFFHFEMKFSGNGEEDASGERGEGVCVGAAIHVDIERLCRVHVGDG